MEKEQEITLDYASLLKVLITFQPFTSSPEFMKNAKKINQETNPSNFINYSSLLQQFSEWMRQHSSEIAIPNMQAPEAKVGRLYMDGCFDLVHSGHFNAIRQAKALTDCLVVGVISSEAIIKNKGPYIMSMDERMNIVRNCKWVDEVVIQDEYNPSIKQIDKCNCSHAAHGDDMILDPNGTDTYSPFRNTGRIKIFKRTEGISTTEIVGRLLLMTKTHHSTAVSNTETRLFKRLSDSDVPIPASQLKEENIFDDLSPPTPNLISGKMDVIEKYERKLPAVQLLNTTRRIRQFSEGNRKPESNDIIVYLAGSFDIFHSGHVQVLEKAKQLGTFLLVGVYHDEGSNYPVLNLQERILNVLASRYVDEVIIGAPWKINQNMIKNFNISKVVSSDLNECNEEQFQGGSTDPYEVPKAMGIYHEIKINSTMSLDQIIEKIYENRLIYLNAQKKKEMKLKNYYDKTALDSQIQEVDSLKKE